MLLNICLAPCTLNYSTAFFHLRGSSPVSPNFCPPVLFSISFFYFFNLFFFSFWNLEPLIVVVFIKKFLSVFPFLSFPCEGLAYMLSYPLTTPFSVFSSLLYFPGLWSPGSSAPGLRVCDHYPSTHLCWIPRCRLKYLFCFVGLEAMPSCLFWETYVLMKQHVQK